VSPGRCGLGFLCSSSKARLKLSAKFPKDMYVCKKIYAEILDLIRETIIDGGEKKVGVN
jgi:hypothetical protein